MDLGSTIKKIRKQKNQTHFEFASRCGMTELYLSEIENNSKEPTLPTLKVISKTLNISLPILFFLSMTEEDVQPNKRKAFGMVSPYAKSLVNEFLAV